MYTNITGTTNVGNVNTPNVVEESVCDEYSFYRKDIRREEIAKIKSEIEKIKKCTTMSDELEEKYYIFIKCANKKNSE